MKLAILCVLAFVVVARASPLDKSKKTEGFGKCDQLCTNQDYKPLCATDGDKITLSFMNECVLKKYNCEQNKILTKKLDKECPNGQGIRLS